MRTPTEAPQLSLTAAKHDVRTYRFITPVFGGGVNLRESDPVTPVRVASIRGQLRFWWRAVNPCGCTSVDELRKAEEEVFGSTTQASRLVVRVSKQPAKLEAMPVLQDGTPFGVGRGMDAIAYGVFPLRATKAPFQHGKLSNFGDELFELVFSYPDAIENHVQAALWAWAHFGALGGRTRRGFGAIAQVSPALPNIDDGWARFVKSAPATWPHLDIKPKFATKPTTDGRAALALLLGALRTVRQGPGIGRRRGEGQSGPHGRSFWPEPDAIRQLFRDQVGEKHGTPVTDQNCFPRAAFGTPIIFHFKQPPRDASRDEKEYAKDPLDSTLMPKGKSRTASRLLLRPHLGASGKVEAMALVLHHPLPPSGYVLLQKDHAEVVSVDLKTPLSIGDVPFTDPIERYIKELLA